MPQAALTDPITDAPRPRAPSNGTGLRLVAAGRRPGPRPAGLGDEAGRAAPRQYLCMRGHWGAAQAGRSSQGTRGRSAEGPRPAAHARERSSRTPARRRRGVRATWTAWRRCGCRIHIGSRLSGIHNSCLLANPDGAQREAWRYGFRPSLSSEVLPRRPLSLSPFCSSRPREAPGSPRRTCCGTAGAARSPRTRPRRGRRPGTRAGSRAASP